MDILTEFIFNNETWELLEQDVDVYDLWHVRERWVEVKVDRFKGGSINGTPKTSSFNRRPYGDVMDYQYGERHPIAAGGQRTEKSMTSKSFSIGAKFTVPLPMDYLQK